MVIGYSLYDSKVVPKIQVRTRVAHIFQQQPNALNNSEVTIVYGSLFTLYWSASGRQP